MEYFNQIFYKSLENVIIQLMNQDAEEPLEELFRIRKRKLSVPDHIFRNTTKVDSAYDDSYVVYEPLSKTIFNNQSMDMMSRTSVSSSYYPGKFMSNSLKCSPLITKSMGITRTPRAERVKNSFIDFDTEIKKFPDSNGVGVNPFRQRLQSSARNLQFNLGILKYLIYRQYNQQLRKR